MQDIFSFYENKMYNILSELHSAVKLPEEALAINFNTEAPKEPEHGDITFNTAMILAPIVKKSPLHIANMLAEELKLDHNILKCQVAKPGFLNVTLKDHCWHEILLDILNNPLDYGSCNLGQGENVNVEFVSANPTGPLHIAHARGAVIGDVIAELLEFCGYNVSREYYVNDQGGQIDLITKSLYRRYQQKSQSQNIIMEKELYPGEYLIEIAEEIYQNHGTKWLNQNQQETNEFMKKLVLKKMIELIKNDLIEIGVKHDLFFYESSLEKKNQLQNAIKILQKKKLIKTGKLPKPKAKTEEWDERIHTLFLSTKYGDDVDRPLFKKDGSPTYFANDIAYHYNKFKRGFNNMVNVLGADHAGYFKRITAAVEAISDKKANLQICSCQIVRIVRNGQIFSMSKRSGDFITIGQVVKEVGADALRFTLLMRKNDMPIDFDLEKAKQSNPENPVFYVQYAYARIQSVLNKAKEMLFYEKELNENINKNINKKKLHLLKNKIEIQIIRKMALWPVIVRNSAITKQPHKIAFYLHELAAEFHSLWNLGKKFPELRFIDETKKDTTNARIAMLKALEIVFSNAMTIIGITKKDNM